MGNSNTAMTMTDCIKDAIKLFGLPDEMYTSLNIYMSVDNVVRISAEFIAKGGSDGKS